MPAKPYIVTRYNGSLELIAMCERASSMSGALWDLYPMPASLRRGSADGAGLAWKSCPRRAFDITYRLLSRSGGRCVYIARCPLSVIVPGLSD